MDFRAERVRETTAEEDIHSFLLESIKLRLHSVDRLSDNEMQRKWALVNLKNKQVCILVWKVLSLMHFQLKSL